MGKRQREWASRRRLWLINLMGGVCMKCGETDKTLLEFDHVDHNLRDWDASKLCQSQRMANYWRDFQEDNLQLLCVSCNRGKRGVIDYRPTNILNLISEDQPF